MIRDRTPPAHRICRATALLVVSLSAAVSCEDGSCPEPEGPERYCIDQNKDECDAILSFCSDGRWQCSAGRQFPPSGDAYLDWAWRCGVIGCNAQEYRTEPGPDWRDAGVYLPPDPAYLTGTWELVADHNRIVPLGCERRTAQCAHVQSFALDPQNPDVMYAGMYLAMYVHQVMIDSCAAGVYKSVDGGRNWFSAWAGLGGTSAGFCSLCSYAVTAHSLYVDPVDPQVVYASTDERGLYRTEDGGKHWVELPFTDTTPPPPGLVRRGLNDTLYFAAGTDFYRFQPDGTGWQAPVALTRPVKALVPDPALPERVWVGMDWGASNAEGPIQVSDDGGSTWRTIGRRSIMTADPPGDFVRGLAICPADPQHMAAATKPGGIFLSDDGGDTWRRAVAPAAGTDGVAVAFAPRSDRCVLVASDDDAAATWLTEDRGATWQVTKLRPLIDLVFNPYRPEMIFGIATDESFELWVRK